MLRSDSGVGVAESVAGQPVGSGGDLSSHQRGGGDGSVAVQAGVHEASGLELVVAPAAGTEIRHAGGSAGPRLVVVEVAPGRQTRAVVGRAAGVHGADVV